MSSSRPASFSPLVPALIYNRREYDQLFSIYVPIAWGVFVIVVLDWWGRPATGGRPFRYAW